jgi:hypothetical protein
MQGPQLLRKAAPVFTLLVLATSAYQVALGLTRLARSVVAGGTPVATPPTPAPEFPVSDEHPTSDDATHGRNLGWPKPARLLSPTAQSYLGAPDCSAIAARIVSQSDHRNLSLASLRVTGEAGSRLCRVGDQVAGHRVEFIGFNPRQSSAAVWFSRGDRLCQALVAAGEPALNARALAGDERSAARMPAEISANLEQLSEREFNLSRAAFDSLFENTLELGRHLRFVPETKNGHVIGVRVFGLRAGTWAAALGLRNGDRLETLNGFSVTRPEALLEAYARLRTASEVSARLTRSGAPVEIAVHVK